MCLDEAMTTISKIITWDCTKLQWANSRLVTLFPVCMWPHDLETVIHHYITYKANSYQVWGSSHPLPTYYNFANQLCDLDLWPESHALHIKRSTHSLTVNALWLSNFVLLNNRSDCLGYTSCSHDECVKSEVKNIYVLEILDAQAVTGRHRGLKQKLQAGYKVLSLQWHAMCCQSYFWLLGRLWL